MTLAPECFSDRIVAGFADPERPAYGQLATVDAHGRPQVRTVHFRYLAVRDAVAFSAHVRSPKWTELVRSKWHAGCYFDQQRLVQWRWEGPVELIDPADTQPSTQPILDAMWSSIRPDVRATYWLDHHGLSPDQPLPPGVDVEQRAPNIGTVICTPTLWDIFELDPTDYRHDRRWRYQWVEGTWRGQRVHLLHSAVVE